MRSFLALALVPALVAPALAQAKRAVKPKSKPAARKPGPDRPSALPGSTPFVVVNGEVIPVSVYVDRMSVAFAPQIREALVEETLLRQEGKKRGLKVTGPELDALVSRVFGQTLQRYGGEENLAKELKATRGWSIADYKTVIRDQAGPQILREKLAASLVADAAVKDEELAARYDANKKQFEVPDTVKISHILVLRPADRNAVLDAAAKAKAEEILKQASAAGADWNKLAQQESQDAATAAKGGQVPIELVRGANPFGDAFEDAVFSAEAGVVPQVVATPTGYHVIRLDARKPGRLLPLAEVKGQLRQSILAERRQQAMEELFVQLRTKADIDTGRF